MSSLVAVFAHPDDEALACGGTLAAAAARGVDVSVLCATRGEHGPALDGRGTDELSERRSRELAVSCRALGAAAPRFLELPDGGLSSRGDELRRRLGAVLRELDPDVAITMGPDGAYGHRDHVACSAALGEVAGATTLLHAVFPRGLFDALRLRLSRAGFPLSTGATVDADADFIVDIRRFAPQKLAAIAAHRSQLADGDPRSFLLPGLVDRLLDVERFRLAAGPAPTGALAELLVRR